MFRQPLQRDMQGVRVAWSRDLGAFPVDPRVTAAIDAQRSTFETLGCLVQDDEPDLHEADEVFKVWRAWEFELGRGDLVRDHPDQVKDTVIWNVEQGRRLSGPQIGRAEIKRTQLYHRVREFMETYEFLILPVSQVPPFDVEQHWVTEIDGRRMETYIDWMKSCYFISVLGLPAISVPCGFTPEGLPVGIQIVGRHQDEFGVLQIAHAFEQATGVWKRHPAIAT
jgi:amidase